MSYLGHFFPAGLSCPLIRGHAHVQASPLSLRSFASTLNLPRKSAYPLIF